MTSQNTNYSEPNPVDPVIKHRKHRPSLVWLLPLIAVIIALSLVIRSWLNEGPVINISFETASGIEEGKTPLKYKDVTVGHVTKVSLSKDHSHIITSIALDKSAESLAVKDSQFWVVRPRIGMEGVSGMDTLFSGAYIATDAGSSIDESTHFKGLETPPSITHNKKGKIFILHAEDLGSLDIGSPVYYRRILVGRVSSYHFNQQGDGVIVNVFIDAPYDNFVKKTSRFWSASGVSFSMNADGMKFNTQSLASVLAGGIAFATPKTNRPIPAEQNQDFLLEKDETTAMTPSSGPVTYAELHFQQSMRGLKVGSPVEFMGVNVGQVVSINLNYNEEKQSLPITVGVDLHPKLFEKVYENSAYKGQYTTDVMAMLLDKFIHHGLRAQARTASLLTGQLLISLDFFPSTKPVAFNHKARPINIPTVEGDINRIQENLVTISSNLAKVPFEQIGQNLNKTLDSLDKTLHSLNTELIPQLSQTMDNTLGPQAPLQRSLTQTLQELKRSTQSIKQFSDTMNRSPESLFKGYPVLTPPPTQSNESIPDFPKESQ